MPCKALVYSQIRPGWGMAGPVSFLLAAVMMLSSAVGPAAAASLAESYCQRGIQLARAGKSRAAEIEFKRALELRQDLVAAHYYLYRLAMQRRRIFEAFDRLREVIALDRHYHNADRVFQELIASLPRHIRKRLREAPRDPEGHQMLGFVLVRIGRFREGVSKLLHALKLDPTRATVYDDLAWAYMLHGRYDKAFEYSEKAFNLAPERPSISVHHKKLYYLVKFGRKTIKTDVVDDFYPPARKRAVVPAGRNEASRGTRGGRARTGTGAVRRGGGRHDDSGRRAGSGDTAGSAGQATSGAAGKDQNPFASGEAEIEFSDVDVDDQALVDELMSGMESRSSTPASTASTAAGGASGNEAGTGGAGEAGGGSRPVKVPSPLEVLKKLSAAYEEGRTCLETGRYDQARRSFEVVAQLQPGYKDVERLLDKATKLAETRERLGRGQDLLAAGAYDRALSEFRKIRPSLLERVSNLKSVDNYIGECLFRKQRYDEAAPILERWLDGHGDDYRLRYMLARCLYHTGRYADAYRHLSMVAASGTKVLEEFPDHRSFLVRLFIKKNIKWIAAMAVLWMLLFCGYLGWKIRGRSQAQRFRDGFTAMTRLVREEDWKSLLELCDELDGYGPGEVERYRIDYGRCQALLGLGKLDEAKQACMSLLERHDQDGMVHRLLALTLLEAGDKSEEAIARYKALLVNEPNNIPCLEMLNNHFQSRDQVDDEAEKVLLTLRELCPDKSEYELQLCTLYLKRSQYDDTAEAVFARYLQHDDTNLAVREGYARCLARRKAWLEVLRECNTILRQEPSRRSALELLAECYRSLGMFEEAVARFKSLLREYPDDQWLTGQIESMRNEAKEQKERIEAEKKSGEDFSLYYNRGVKLYGNGRYNEALTPLQAAFRSEKFRLHSGNLLVKIHLKLKDTAAARRVFEQMGVPRETGGDEAFLLELCYEMAGVYAAEGLKKRAFELYSYVCKVDVDYKDAFKRLEDLQEELKLSRD